MIGTLCVSKTPDCPPVCQLLFLQEQLKMKILTLSHLWLEEAALWKYSKSQIALEPSTLSKQHFQKIIIGTELRGIWKAVMLMILVSIQIRIHIFLPRYLKLVYTVKVGTYTLLGTAIFRANSNGYYSKDLMSDLKLSSF